MSLGSLGMTQRCMSRGQLACAPFYDSQGDTIEALTADGIWNLPPILAK
jgi:hypothetical protein